MERVCLGWVGRLSRLAKLRQAFGAWRVLTSQGVRARLQTSIPKLQTRREGAFRAAILAARLWEASANSAAYAALRAWSTARKPRIGCSGGYLRTLNTAYANRFSRPRPQDK